MLLRRLAVEPVREVRAGHRTVAGEGGGAGIPDPRFDRPRDLARQRIGVALDAVGAVVAGAALDGDDYRARHQRENVAGLGTDLLHALVAGDVPGKLAQRE